MNPERALAKSNSTRVRVAAARALTEVLDRHRTLDEATAHQSKTIADDDKALLREIVSGSCRWFHEANAILANVLDTPIRPSATDVKALLLNGIYQLLHMRVPAHAVINESVEAVKALRQAWATGLVNAVLRKVSRESDALLAALPEDARLAHPRWLIKRYREHWPEQSDDMLAAANDYPPMTVRVNARTQSRSDWMSAAAAIGLNTHACRYSDTGVTLDRATSVERLPGFSEGMVSVQDEAAQLCAALLDCQPGDRVLDACAAPGGKTGHLLERTAGLHLTALDVQPTRLERVRDNLARLKFEADLRCANATQRDQWWNGEPFQRILLDAPCSGTGVIRRHPDIKILRKPGQIDQLNAEQSALLDALWVCLAPGGHLLYATCSVLPEENENIVADFCARTPEAKAQPLSLGVGVATQHGWQILPTPLGPDGFFYALLHKPER